MGDASSALMYALVSSAMTGIRFGAASPEHSHEMGKVAQLAFACLGGKPFSGLYLEVVY